MSQNHYCYMHRVSAKNPDISDKSDRASLYILIMGPPTKITPDTQLNSRIITNIENLL